MKIFIIIILTITLITSCNNDRNIIANKEPVPGVTRLTMSEDVQNIYSARSQNLIAKLGTGTVMLKKLKK